MIVSGNIRKALLVTPAPQNGTPCGVVDTLDFPLDPPDAENISFRARDFGVYRDFYGGYHTGEDWWGPGRQSFGLPVYSIGHGMVTYADPLGWGGDKGTVVVRHVLPDGSAIFSFYGHLDPPSVVLSAGDCVARGERVGRIGRPTSPPHLHFEIRTHTPNAPGPGYWPSDPALAGWKSPSQYITDYRIATSPGVQWVQPFAVWGTRGVGMLNDDTFVAIEDNQLVGINVLDGDLRWSQTSSIRAKNAVMGKNRSVIYTASHYTGRVEAFRVSDSALIQLWEIKLGVTGTARLMLHPNGGVVISFRNKTFGLSSAGELLWERDATRQAFDWVLYDDLLIFSTIEDGGSTWMVDESGPIPWATATGGHLVVVDDQVLMYGETGVYRLNPETLSADLLYPLPKSLLKEGDMVALPDGGVLLTHVDPFDRRLIALNADGTLRWQRSYKATVQGHAHRLLVVDSHPFFVSYYRASSFNRVSIFAIDLEQERLIRIFTAIGSNPRPEDAWVVGISDERLLLNVGSGSLVALDTQSALDAVVQAMSSQ